MNTIFEFKNVKSTNPENALQKAIDDIYFTIDA